MRFKITLYSFSTVMQGNPTWSLLRLSRHIPNSCFSYRNIIYSSWLMLFINLCIYRLCTLGPSLVWIFYPTPGNGWVERNFTVDYSKCPFCTEMAWESWVSTPTFTKSTAAWQHAGHVKALDTILPLLWSWMHCFLLLWRHVHAPRVSRC